MYRDIPIKDVRPSENNYRRSFDKTALEELTASVKAKGVIEPIIVRPLNGKNKGKFEIVAGHRRHQAALGAGLTEMPSIVKELSDEEALEMQVIENSQRENPNPIDEAHGFKKLLDMGKLTPETLAEKIDHSVGYVLSRLKLAALSKEAQAKVVSGELSLGHALLLTRLKNPDEQKEFLKEMLEDSGTTFARAKELFDYNYTARLSNVVFNTADCEKCPYRSRNQAVLFPDLKKTDSCTDRACMGKKIEQHYFAILKAKKTEGFKVFTDLKEIEKLTSYSSKTSVKIGAPGGERYVGEVPRRYKSECAKCFEHHAFYLGIQKEYHGGNPNRVQFGELCLDKKCFTEMNYPKRGNGQGPEESGSSAQSEGASNPQKARECRDRFLARVIPPKVEASGILRKRLAIFHIFCRLSTPVAAELIKKFNPAHKVERYPDGWENYRGIAAVPESSLDEFLKAVALASLEVTGREVLLEMLPESGVNLKKEVMIDEAYVQGMTKDGIVGMAKELGLDIGLDAGAKKSEMVTAFLAQDLTGKLTKELAKEFAPEVEGEDLCEECGTAREDCGCDL